ncbi:hypothetical protein [Pedobacter sp. SL55]|uniref:hypothetical protein n=1 Tax=Pedobacter sp. SL55 TaxID=2995161 RepID=UPI00226FFB20|nr:hypothetical protein [Pedobacter sp. SL55]WAC42572.1 hypothetical protein OVA16_09520 [Pedobacter sp. SL55]
MILFFLFFVLPLPLLILFFVRSKSRKAKWLIGVAMLLFLAFVSFMAIGLWSMDVEDLYGDKQEIFWEGSSGDTVKLIDHHTQVHFATGILKKTWHRINVAANGKEADIVGWIENETGLYYVETEQKIKNGVITITVFSPRDAAYFIGAYPDELTLELNWIGENFAQYKLKAICEHQIPQLENGLAMFQQAKKDTLVYQNKVDGNNLTISVLEKKGNRKAKIYRKGDGKKANFEALAYDQFREK